jgi:hypothetical protein
LPLCERIVGVGLVWINQSKAAQQQVGEHICSPLLFSARIVGTQAPGCGCEHAVDCGRVVRRHLAGDIPHAVDPLNYRHPAFSEGSSVPPLEGLRLKTHDQPQQPGTELLGTAGLRGIDGLLVDRNQCLGLGDPPSHSIDHSNLVAVKITTAKRIPDRG